MRGRKPQPTALKVLRGNPHQHRLNRAEPKPPAPADLTPPPSLDAAAAAEWIRLAPQLAQLGLLTTIDADALATYCQVLVRWKDAQVQIGLHGMVSKGRISPYMNISDRCVTQLRHFLIEFGMTPSSRARVKPDPGRKPEDPFTSFDDGETRRRQA